MGRLFSVSTTPLTDACKAEQRRIARALTESVRTSALQIKDGMRADAESAGFSPVVANTWRGNGFPNRNGKVSLEPVGLVYSNMPKMAERFTTGQDIVPVNGHTYLAIPVEKTNFGARRKRLTVAEMQKRMGQKLIVVPGKNGNKLGFFDMALSKGTGQRKRGQTKRNLKLFFVFVKVVKGRKVFDLKGTAATILADLPAQVQARLLAS